MCELYERQEPQIFINKTKGSSQSLAMNQRRNEQAQVRILCAIPRANGEMQLRDSDAGARLRYLPDWGRYALARGLTFRSTYLTFELSLDHYTPSTSIGIARSTFFVGWQIP